jgi:alpha-1,6-mannosyltransferase
VTDLPAVIDSPVPSVAERGRAPLGMLDITEFHGPTTGGVRTYLHEKAAYMERRPELRQVIVVPGPVDDVTDASGVRCYRLGGPLVPTQHPYRLMYSARSVRRIVERERPDVIEVGSPGLAPWLAHRAAAPLGIPLVHFFHSNYPALFGRGIGRAAVTRYARALDRRFAVTIVATAAAAEDLRRIGIDRVVRVPLGVNAACFDPRRRAAGLEWRERFGVAGGPLVVFAGRLAAEKRLDLLLSAWGRIHASTGARLLLIGDGPLRPALLDEIRTRPWSLSARWFPFVGERERLAALLAGSDLFVSAGTAETFGLAALEAMACGTPVLSADEGGVAEQVRRSGAGALFRAGDAASLAARAIELLTSELEPVRERARAYAVAEHDWNRVFDRIVSLYRTVVAA